MIIEKRDRDRIRRLETFLFHPNVPEAARRVFAESTCLSIILSLSNDSREQVLYRVCRWYILNRYARLHSYISWVWYIKILGKTWDEYCAILDKSF